MRLCSHFLSLAVTMRSELVAIACFSAAVAAHGKVTSPPARVAGPAMAAACGDGAITALKEDDTIPLEDIPNPPASCRLSACLASGALLTKRNRQFVSLSRRHIRRQQESSTKLLSWSNRQLQSRASYSPRGALQCVGCRYGVEQNNRGSPHHFRLVRR